MKFIALFVVCLLVCQSHAQSIFDHARSGDSKAFEQILKEYPEKAFLTNDQGYTPLILASYYNHIEAVHYLLETSKVDVDIQSNMGTALMASVVKNHVDLSLLLLSFGADPNLVDANGTSALHYATMFQHKELVHALIKADADPNLKDQTGRSALDYAHLLNNKNIINLFKHYSE
jgi:ankyrin repeat protein